MAVVISAITFTRRDDAGNPWTELWGTIEFRDPGSGYVPGGENVALNTYFRRIEQVQVNPISGALDYEPAWNYADLPGAAGSTRATLRYAASGLVTLNISGLGVSVASGTQLFISGQLLSGNISGQVFGILFSGRIAATGSGVFGQAGLHMELISGVAVSGVRAAIHVLGF